MIDRSAHDWYKDAVIYQTHIKAFFDSNDDGIGDFQGLIQKLDYIQSLGVNAIWLLPFYPSPLRDDGYDIADYRGVNPAYGTVSDVKRLIKEAHRRGIRIITELVVNHTSDQHPWFQRARHAKPGSRYRDYYVWNDTDQKYTDTRIIFLDTESSNWTWDPVARAYFWHRFYSHQPDLNFDNPVVRREIIGVLRHWLDMGVDGLRLDAVPYLIEREGTNCENLDETHDILKEIRAEIDANYPDRMLLAEANQWPEDTRPYFGDGDECHMAFHFPLMPRMYMALAQEDRHPITDILRQTPEIPENCQWAIFLRNHDELTLEMVTEKERDYLWRFYAADPRMRINLGIRRRLAPLMDNDRRKIELMMSLLMSMPGSPVLYYGDELGMGDNIYLGDRDGVRTPMQWSPDRNGGFSRADPQKLFLPSVMDPVYGFQGINVEAQDRNPTSLLNWTRRLVSVRRNHKAFSRASVDFLYPGNRKILAFIREHEGEAILCVANISRTAQPVELHLQDYKGRVPVELLGRNAFPPIGELPYLLTLQPYGFYWFLLAEEAEVPSWHTDAPEPMPEFVTLVVPEGLKSLFDGRPRKEFEGGILRSFMQHQRWFAAKGEGLSRVRIGWASHVEAGPDSHALLGLEAAIGSGDTQTYLLPLDIAWGEENVGHGNPLLPYTVAEVRRGPRLGALCDGTHGGAFARATLKAMLEDKTVDTPDGALRYLHSPKFEFTADLDELEIRRLGAEQSNSSIMIGQEVIMKAYRRLSSGIHPEVEVGRFLTDVAGFENTPPLVGSLERIAPDGTATALAAAFGYIWNQGDGWHFTLDYLKRELDTLTIGGPEEEAKSPEDIFGLYNESARGLGRRTADMHRAFAIDTDDEAFAREPVDVEDLRDWQLKAEAQLDKALEAVKRVLPDLEGDDRETVDRFVAAEPAIRERLKALSETPVEAAKTRVHGDYHLGQVLVAKDDFFILDFEGEPSRPLEERRAKTSPLKDVAGMLRSFDYAAWAAVDAMSDNGRSSRGALTHYALMWREEACRNFLNAYRETMGDCPSLPEPIGEANRLLETFLLEKAFYELVYEASNRPRWVSIPLRGILGLLETNDESQRFT
ncbi:maltose alpha-D-glucosyltransferase [Lutibaculum baratangense]|uniref:maltose alpha-D-glucosyltransferase n=1 Tax=Lutibaculum baratangense AMV1 TaxID=631454 RepID=V4RB10_9HYPH|nr:maltose alpha-D-glucosyltransferase [Lutibaculum baratangense]ESR22589.1 Trehalose synthase [Lutibaculum baratangense AMV1]